MGRVYGQQAVISLMMQAYNHCQHSEKKQLCDFDTKKEKIRKSQEQQHANASSILKLEQSVFPNVG